MKGRYVFLISVAVGAALSFAIAPVQHMAACGSFGPDQHGWQPAGVYDHFCDSPTDCADCADYVCGGPTNWDTIKVDEIKTSGRQFGVSHSRSFFAFEFRCRLPAQPECDAAECPMPDASVTQ